MRDVLKGALKATCLSDTESELASYSWLNSATVPPAAAMGVKRQCSDSSAHNRSVVVVEPVVVSNSGWLGSLGSRVVSVLDSGAEGPGFKSQSRRCWVTVLGKLFTPVVPLFTKQRNW